MGIPVLKIFHFISIKTCKIILEKQPIQEEINTAKSNLNKTFRVPVDYDVTPLPGNINISKINKLDKPTIHVANTAVFNVLVTIIT